jgi:hypothetical protein
MNFIEFLFKLIRQFVPLDERKEIRLQNEATEWYNSQLEEESKNPLAKVIQSHGEKWYIQTGLAVLYIFAVRWVAEFMSGASGNDQYED